MRVVVAMSGGVDSSVSALLLKEQGHEVIGVFLRNGVEARAGGSADGHGVGRGHGCCGVTDALDAEEVANALGVAFYAIDHSREFATIVDEFVESYARGETPNPCVQCNRDLKFGALLTFARGLGAQRVATGHYARVRALGDDGVELLRGRDRAKDQSYVLASVPRAALAQALFPVGELEKSEVREHARRAGLPVHAKPESQELCFVPSGDHRDVLRARRPDLFRQGAVVDASGRSIGVHEGAAGFTVGQRRGLGLAAGAPRYVVASDPGTNTVVVGTREETRRVRATLARPNWLAPRPASDRELRIGLQVRAHHAPVAATARTGPERASDAGATDRIDLALDPPGETLTPGQLGVLYEGDRVVAGGTLKA